MHDELVIMEDQYLDRLKFLASQNKYANARDCILVARYMRNYNICKSEMRDVEPSGIHSAFQQTLQLLTDAHNMWCDIIERVTEMCENDWPYEFILAKFHIIKLKKELEF